MTAGELIEIERARALVLRAARSLPPEPVELQAALGRVLGEGVRAERRVPPFDSSAMDGFAVRAEDVAGADASRPASLRIIDESRAGAPARAAIAAGEAIAISTGAMLPAGADTIVRVEDTRTHDGRVEVLVALPAGCEVRRAGEDVAAGQTVLERGALLGPAELGVLASLGTAQVRCARRPRLSLLVSGDELLAPGEPYRPGAINDSNSLTIWALARRGGADVVRRARVGDDAAATRAAVGEALRDVDLAVICGGVSVGMHDHVRTSLAALGAQQAFWGIALKPGRPTWFGTLGQTLVFGLPGNPVSAMVTFMLLVQPALDALLGRHARRARATAVLEGGYEKPAGRAHALRCRLSAQSDGWHAEPAPAQGSHVLTSMLEADALAIVPSDTVSVRAGERVEIEPLRPCAEARA